MIRRRFRGAGRASNDKIPHGWQSWSEGTGFSNPRPPAVPATLELTKAEYFAAASLIGLLASQRKEPNQEWARKWAYEMGEKMARSSRGKAAR